MNLIGEIRLLISLIVNNNIRTLVLKEAVFMMRPSAILQAPLHMIVGVTDELISPEISLQIILIFMMKVN